MTALLVARHPSLAPLAREGHDYLLSSLQKLDQPPSRSSSSSSHAWQKAQSGVRPVVLAVVGRSHLRYVQRNW